MRRRNPDDRRLHSAVTVVVPTTIRERHVLDMHMDPPLLGTQLDIGALGVAAILGGVIRAFQIFERWRDAELLKAGWALPLQRAGGNDATALDVVDSAHELRIEVLLQVRECRAGIGTGDDDRRVDRVAARSEHDAPETSVGTMHRHRFLPPAYLYAWHAQEHGSDVRERRAKHAQRAAD